MAGMRAGLADPRGALTIKYVELLNAIDHVRTRRGDPEAVCLWENVPGVLSDKGNAFGCFLAALVGESEELQPPGQKWKDAGCVYGPRRTVAWRILDAQYFGLAQRRRRVFVVASARKGFDPVEVLFEREGMRRDIAPRRGQGQNPAGHSPFGPSVQCEYGDPHNRDDGTAIGVIEEVSAFGGHSLGGSIEQTATLTTKATRLDIESETFVITSAVAGTLRSTNGGSDVDHAMAGHLVSGTLNANGKAAGSATQQAGESRLLIVHGTQDPCISNKAFALGRNNGQENVLAFSGTDQGVDAYDVTHAIQAGAARTNPRSGPDGVGVQIDRAYTLEARAEVQAVQIRSKVRRLTPREYERLQGFPDDYTLIPYRGRPADQCPDGPRYKAIGNSKAVPIVRWIGSRILLQL
ncbi:DNA cytosine methyltransferase [Pseudomonas sp. 3A(2025)]